jgi:hypothetical protein
MDTWWSTIKFFNHCSPEDKYDILEYSWVKATTVSIRLRISLFALTNTNIGHHRFAFCILLCGFCLLNFFLVKIDLLSFPTLRFASAARLCGFFYDSFLLRSLLVCLSYSHAYCSRNASCASLLAASSSFSLFINPIMLLLISFFFFDPF